MPKSVPRTLVIPEPIDNDLRVVAALRRVSKSKLYRLGAELLLTLINNETLPQCIIEFLAAKGEDRLLEELKKIVHGEVVIVG